MNKNREYKSDVFAMLLEEKQYALQIYNALNQSQYVDAEEITIIRLDKGITLSLRNDAAFIIGVHMNLYEHQSTYNPNMPLRNMIYYSNTMEEWIKKNGKDLYGRRLIRIPTPHFVVFYNGTEKRPEFEEMKLSDAFEQGVKIPDIEITCRVFNINDGYNQQLMKQAPVLAGYSQYVNKVRRYTIENQSLEEAIDRAIEECIKENILENFFSRRRDEVRRVTHLDFTWERREELIRKEEFEQGIEQGIEQERNNTMREKMRADRLEKRVQELEAMLANV